MRSRLFVFCILFSFIMLILSFETARKVDSPEQQQIGQSNQPQEFEEKTGQFQRIERGADVGVVQSEKETQPLDQNQSKFPTSGADWFEISQWRVKNGARELVTFDSESFVRTKPSISSYDTYGTELLLAMAEGDPYAVLALANRYFYDGDLDAAEPWLIKSATYGFAQPMFNLFGLHSQKANSARGRKETEYGRQHHIESLAWMKVVDLIYFAEPPSLTDVNKMYRILEPEDVKMVLAQADLRGIEIYNQLRLERQKQGLGDFVADMPLAFQNIWRTARERASEEQPPNQ